MRGDPVRGPFPFFPPRNLSRAREKRPKDSREEGAKGRVELFFARRAIGRQRWLGWEGRERGKEKKGRETTLFRGFV